MQGHLFCALSDGTTVELRLIEGGYVGYQELGWYFVKMPGETFEAVLAALPVSQTFCVFFFLLSVSAVVRGRFSLLHSKKATTEKTTAPTKFTKRSSIVS